MENLAIIAISTTKAETTPKQQVNLLLKTSTTTFDKEKRITKIVVKMQVKVSKYKIGAWHDYGSGNNKSYIKISEYGQGGENGWFVNSAGTDLSGSSQVVYFDGTMPQIDGGKTGTTYTIKTCTFYLKHNASGDGKFTVSCKWNINSSWGGMETPSGSSQVLTADHISVNKAAEIIGDAPNVKTGLSTPVSFKISKPTGANAVSVKMSYKDAEGRSQTIQATNSGNFKFENWTVTIQPTIYNTITFGTTESSKNITYIVTTTYTNGAQASEINKIGTLTLGTSPEIDTSSIKIENFYPIYNNKPVELTGTEKNRYVLGEGSKKNLKYAVTFSATGSKDQNGTNESTITKLTCNGVTPNENGQIIVPLTQTLTLTATDSRGLVKEIKYSVGNNYVEYIPLNKVQIENTRTRIDVKGDSFLDFDVSGNVFWGSFGNINPEETVRAKKVRLCVLATYTLKSSGTTNSLETQKDTYKTGEEGGYGLLVTTIDNFLGRFLATFSIPNYRINETYTIESTAILQIVDYNATNDDIAYPPLGRIDEVKATTEQKEVLPIFDYSEKDFTFNVPVNYNIDRMLWNGDKSETRGYYMNENQTISLSKRISEQSNGIVLVFSYYDKGKTNKGLDWGFHSFFIHKDLVKSKSGCGSCFNLNGDNFTYMGQKYLYISDNKITGHEDNTLSGQRSGITYDNSFFVLRYVFGV